MRQQGLGLRWEPEPTAVGEQGQAVEWPSHGIASFSIRAVLAKWTGEALGQLYNAGCLVLERLGKKAPPKYTKRAEGGGLCGKSGRVKWL